MLKIILYGIATGFTLAIPLGMGPAFFVLVETSIRKGFKAALYFDLGVIVVDIVFIAIAYLGSQPLRDIMQNTPILFLIGGIGLVLFGLVTLLKKEKSNNEFDEVKKVKKTNYLLLFMKGFLLNFINVGVLIYWIGVVFFVVGTMDLGHADAMICFATILITYLCIDFVKILLAKRFKKIMTPTRMETLKKVLGYVLIIFGIIIALKVFT